MNYLLIYFNVGHNGLGLQGKWWWLVAQQDSFSLCLSV